MRKIDFPQFPLSTEPFAPLQGQHRVSIYAYIPQPVEANVPIARTRTFKSGNSEALRLPRDVAYGEGVELVIVRSGDVMTIYPATASIASMIEELQRLPKPSAIEQRDVEELPERPGL